MLTIEAIFAQPDNEAALRHLNLCQPKDIPYFETATDGSPFDEGGQIFFHKYGRKVPATARCAFGTVNLMAHERTARIFALHQGRFTILIRRVFPMGESPDGRRLRYEETLDGAVDLSLLGPSWELFHADGVEEAIEEFL